MAKARRKKKPAIVEIVGPTPEQAEQHVYERAGLAYKRVPTIVGLMIAGKLSERQYNGLTRYRDIGIKCERSETMDSIQRLLHIAGGAGDGPSIATIRAYEELGQLERALGSLADIARAICIDDITMSQWAMQQGGAVERRRDKGQNVVVWFEPRRKAMDIAWIELRMAGERLAAAIGA